MDELVKFGKGGWAVPREDKVEAKGKGTLSTWWLEIRESEEKALSTNSYQSEMMSAAEYMSPSAYMSPAEALRLSKIRESEADLNASETQLAATYDPESLQPSHSVDSTVGTGGIMINGEYFDDEMSM